MYTSATPEVAGQQNQSDDDARVCTETEQCKRTVDLIPDQRQMLGKGTDKRDLDELGRLHIDADTGDAEPAFIGGFDGLAGRAEHECHGKEPRRRDQHDDPEFIHDDAVIHVGDDKHTDRAEQRHGDLHEKRAAAERASERRVFAPQASHDRNKPDDGQSERGKKQDGIHPAAEFPDRPEECAQAKSPPFF